MNAAELVARLAQEGIDPTLLSEVAQELFTGEIERKALADRKQKDRARKAKSREVTGSHVTERDGTGQPVTPSLEVSPENPLPNPAPSPPLKPPASQKASDKGTRLADDFQAPDDWIEWAMSKRGWSRAEAVDEAECFTRYWQAKPGREARKRDWPKTWQNWAANSRRQQQRTTGPPSFLDHLVETGARQ